MTRLHVHFLIVQLKVAEKFLFSPQIDVSDNIRSDLLMFRLFVFLFDCFSKITLILF